jgi:inner membrane protein
MTPDAYYEGWYSLLDPERKFTWEKFLRDETVTARHTNHPDVLRVASFSDGFFNVEERDRRLYVTDLRLGLEPFYSFRFDLGSLGDAPLARSERVGIRPDLASGLPWLWQRIKGDTESYVSYRARMTR